MKRGDQIVYVPTHAKGDVNHPDCERGFITSVANKSMGDAYFCRYWSKYSPGELRTKSNSELTSAENLVEELTVAQEVIDKLLKDIPRWNIL